MYKRTGEKLAPLSANKIVLYQQLKQGCWCLLWPFAQGLSTHQDQYRCWAICVYSRWEKRGQPDLQLVIRCRWVPGPSVRAAYMMENIDFFFQNDTSCWPPCCGYDSAVSWAGLDQGRRYPLSQVRLFDTVGSCWLKHFPVCLLVCVWRGYLGFSIWAVDSYSARVTEAFDLLRLSRNLSDAAPELPYFKPVAQN